jgi:hypothetical protein
MNSEGSQSVYLRKDLGKGVKEGIVSAFAIPVAEKCKLRREVPDRLSIASTDVRFANVMDDQREAQLSPTAVPSP